MTDKKRKPVHRKGEGASSMPRRDFLKAGGLAGAAALTGPFLVRCSREPGLSQTGQAAFPFTWEEAGIADLAKAMAAGNETSRSLCKKYLDRIDKIDRRGPRVNSVIEINPDALAIADALDRERKSKGSRGPLHGIPVLIKDNIGTADRMTTTAGSLALEGSIPLQDSFVAKRLREAGAVILGKTNLSEWANFRSTRSSSGWSGRGGQTRNPYVLDRNPSGSSSGSAAAVASNLCAAAIGTETDGSVVSPSSNNSIVGIKPTVGLVSRTGIVPIAHSQDTAGPMCRSVADAALLLTAMIGFDPLDPSTSALRNRPALDFVTCLDPKGLSGARIGVVRRLFGFHEEVDRRMEEALTVMKDLNAVLVDPVELDNVGKYSDSEFDVLLYEFKADLNAYLAGQGPNAPVRTLEEIIAFNKKNREREMPFFGQEIFEQAQAKGPLTDSAYRKALAKNLRLSRTEGIDAVIIKHKLDALVAPTDGPAWTTDVVNGDHFSGGCSTPPAVAGYPHVTVPNGYVHGLPVGISFFGRALAEPVLIKLAYAFEQATQLRRPPMFLPAIDPNPLLKPDPENRPNKSKELS